MLTRSSLCLLPGLALAVIADPARFEHLLKLARHFAVLGDAALAFDGERARAHR